MNKNRPRHGRDLSRDPGRKALNQREKREIEGHFRVSAGPIIAKCREEEISGLILIGSMDLSEILIPIWREFGGPEIQKIVAPNPTRVRRIHDIAVSSIQSKNSIKKTAILLNIKNVKLELEIYRECRTLFPEASILSVWSSGDLLNFHHELAERAVAIGRRCLDGDANCVAIFGTGSHTRYLLKEWKGLGGPSVKAILTSKESQETEIEGIRIQHIDNFIPSGVDAIVLSSHSHEAELYALCKERWPRIQIYALWHTLDELQSSFELEKLVQCVISQCNADGVKRIVFYGAGVHTQNMVPIWRKFNGPEIVGLIVTNANGAQTFAGLRMSCIDSFDISATDGIVLSSKAFETEMAETCLSRWPLLPFYPVWNPSLRLSSSSLNYVIPNAIHRCKAQSVQSVIFVGTSGLLGPAEQWWKKWGGPDIIGCIRAIASYDAEGKCVYKPEPTKLNLNAVDAVVVLNSPDCAGLAKDIRGLWPEKIQILVWPVEAEVDSARIPAEIMESKRKLAKVIDESEIAFQEWVAVQAKHGYETIKPDALKNNSEIKIDIFCIIGNSPSIYIREMLKSVVGQSYRHWELFLVMTVEKAQTVETIIKEIADSDSRIHICVDRTSKCVWSGLYTAFKSTSSDVVIPLGDMDALSQHALLRTAEACRENQQWDILIGERRDTQTKCMSLDAIPKPDCSRLCSIQNYSFSALTVIRRQFLNDVWARKERVGCYLELADLMQRNLKASRIHDIPGPLHFWRCAPGSKAIAIRRMTKRTSQWLINMDARPLKVVLDARLLHRNTTGTERYIATLLEGFSGVAEEANVELTVLLRRRPANFPRRAMAWLTGYSDAIRSGDVFHRTIQAYDVESLKEMADARACVYTIHDLISYIYGDYMPSDRAFQTYRTVARTGARLASHIITVSEHARREIIRAFEVEENRITAIHNAIIPKTGMRKGESTVEKTFAGRKLPRRYFLVAGTDYPHKNMIGLLRAYQSVRSQLKDIKIVSVGVKYYQKPQPDLDAIIKKLGDDFVDLGFVTDEQLHWLYKNATALIFPSLYEGFGYPPLEAMQHGTPVAASNSTSIPEVTGPAALLFNGQDKRSIAKALVDISTDKSLRSRLIRNGYKRIHLFPLEKTATKTIEAYFKGWRQSIEDRYSSASTRSIQTAPSERSKITILFVTHVPIWKPAAGNELRLFNLVRHLKGGGYRIAMIYCPLDGKPVPQSGRDKIAKYVDNFYDITEEERLLAASGPSPIYDEILKHQEGGLAKWRSTEDGFCPKAVVLKTKEVLDLLNPNVLVAEYIWMSRVLKLAAPGCLRIIDLHDKFSDKKDKVNAFGINDTLAVTPEEEKDFLSRCDIALAIQEEEARAFRQMGVRPLVITVGVDFPTVPKKNFGRGGDHRVLIVASDNPLNVKCIQSFIDKSWPIVRQSEQRAKLRIVGGVCKRLNSTDKSIQLSGYRPDLEAEYASACMVVNPVIAGTGLKIKSIEALSHGKPLVATKEAVEGIPIKEGVSCLIGRDWADLAGKILEILGNKELRRTMGDEAHLLAQKWLSAEHVYGELMKCLSLFLRHEL